MQLQTLKSIPEGRFIRLANGASKREVYVIANDPVNEFLTVEAEDDVFELEYADLMLPRERPVSYAS